MNSARRYNEGLKGSLIGEYLEAVNVEGEDRLQILAHETFMNGLMKTGALLENQLETTNKAANHLLGHYR